MILLQRSPTEVRIGGEVIEKAGYIRLAGKWRLVRQLSATCGRGLPVARALRHNPKILSGCVLGALGLGANVLLPSGVSSARPFRHSWDAVVGGMHYAMDVDMTREGAFWASGAGISKYDKVLQTWRVTDWAYGYRVSDINVDDDGNGWALLNPDNSSDIGSIARLDRGVINVATDYAHTFWTDLESSASGDALIAAGYSTREGKPSFFMHSSTGWTPMEVTSADRSAYEWQDFSIQAIGVESLDLAYAVTQMGTLWAWDGVGWSIQSRAPTKGMFVNDISVPDPAAVIIVGGAGGSSGQFVARYDGHVWEVLVWEADMPELTAVAARNASEAWMVGYAGTVYAMRADKLREVGVTYPTGIGFSGLRDVAYINETDSIIAAGDDGQIVIGDEFGVRFFSDYYQAGLYWSVLLIGSNTALLGGARCPRPLCQSADSGDVIRPRILRLDSQGFREESVAKVDGGVTDFVHSGTEALAVGGISSLSTRDGVARGFVLRFDGSQWNAVTLIDSTYPQRTVTDAMGNLWVAGNSQRGLQSDASIVRVDSQFEIGDRWDLANSEVNGVAVIRDLIVAVGSRRAPGGDYVATVWSFDRGEWRAQELSGRRATAVIADGDNMWVFVTGDSGTLVYRGRGGSFRVDASIDLSSGSFICTAAVGSRLLAGSSNGTIVEHNGDQWEVAFRVSDTKRSLVHVADIASITDKGVEQIVAVGFPSMVLGQNIDLLPVGPGVASPTFSLVNTPNATPVASGTPGAHRFVAFVPVSLNPSLR